MTNDNTLHSLSIGFIGAGNMAKAIIGGLIQGGFPATQLWASGPTQSELDYLNTHYAMHTTQDNPKLVHEVDVLIFAVKPDRLKTVVTELKAVIHTKKTLLISIAAGISTQAIYNWLDDVTHQIPLVRTMPNTPALINQGITGVYPACELSPTNREIIHTILSAIGNYVWLEKEDWLDIVTGLSGSGPAFIFYILEAMIAKASALGLPEDIATELALKTCAGSANLALNSQKDLAELRHNVTSKGGTTLAGLQKAEELNLSQSIGQIINAAVERSKDMREQNN